MLVEILPARSAKDGMETDASILHALQILTSMEQSVFAQTLQTYVSPGSISMEKNAYISRILVLEGHGGMETLALQQEIALKDSIKTLQHANLSLSVVFPLQLGMEENVSWEPTVLSVLLNLVSLVNHITNAAMDKSGIQTCFSVFAQRTLDGTESSVLHVGEAKSGIFMKDVNVERGISSREINVS